MIRECFQRIFSAKKSHDTGGPAFPLVYNDDLNSTTEIYPGMTLRDYFAAKAMQGLLAQSMGTALGSPVEAAADYAYTLADAMMKARQA